MNVGNFIRDNAPEILTVLGIVLIAYALAKAGASLSDVIAVAGGSIVLVLLIQYAKGNIDRSTIEQEMSKQIDDPIQLKEYKRLLDNEDLLQALKECA